MNGQVTKNVDSSTAVHSECINSDTVTPFPTTTMLSTHEKTFTDPLLSIHDESVPIANSSDTIGDTAELVDSSMLNFQEISTGNSLSNLLVSDSGLTGDQAMLEPTTSLDEGSSSTVDDDGGPSSLDLSGPGGLMTSTAITNLPPVPSNMYNISSMAGIEDAPNSMDLFESCVEDGIMRPFSSITLAAPQVLICSEN